MLLDFYGSLCNYMELLKLYGTPVRDYRRHVWSLSRLSTRYMVFKFLL